MVVRIRPPTCGLPVAIHEIVVNQDPTGCLIAFYFSPFEVRDDSNPSGDGLSHLNRIKLGGAATRRSSRQWQNGFAVVRRSSWRKELRNGGVVCMNLARRRIWPWRLDFGAHGA